VKIASSPVYLDASALAKLYIEELESAELELALVGRSDLLVSALSITEVVSALARRVRERDLPARDAGRVHRRILADLSRGEFQQVDLSPNLHRVAERMLLQIGTISPLRASDALHLALAGSAPAGAFVTYDRHLRDAAIRMASFEVHG
jgi:predicted nucleic acid-binding protein